MTLVFFLVSAGDRDNTVLDELFAMFGHHQLSALARTEYGISLVWCVNRFRAVVSDRSFTYHIFRIALLILLLLFSLQCVVCFYRAQL